ncbi:unnamed protein product [Amoebophrya sp. A120]|nr:unnamed protein product [Amoebophrya sp. A120]|eukprot:GSA120T00024598001.1
MPASTTAAAHSAKKGSTGLPKNGSATTTSSGCLRTIRIRNLSGTKVVEKLVDPSKVLTVADLCAHDIIADAIDADQLLPPVHRLQWLQITLEETSADENYDDAQPQDPGAAEQEHEHPETFLDRKTPIDYGDVDGGLSTAAGCEKSSSKTPVPSFQFVITPPEFSVAQLTNGKSVEEFERSDPYFRFEEFFASFTLEQARSFVYDRSWELIDAMNLKDETKDSARNSLPDTWLPCGTTALVPKDERADPYEVLHHLAGIESQIALFVSLLTAIFELPETEWNKHERLSGGKYFAWARRDRYCRKLRVQFFHHGDNLQPDWNFCSDEHWTDKRREAAQAELGKKIFRFSNLGGQAAAKEIGVVVMNSWRATNFLRVYDAEVELAFRLTMEDLAAQSTKTMKENEEGAAGTTLLGEQPDKKPLLQDEPVNKPERTELEEFCRALEFELSREQIALKWQEAARNYANSNLWADAAAGAAEYLANPGTEWEGDEDSPPTIDDYKAHYREEHRGVVKYLNRYIEPGLESLEPLLRALIQPHVKQRDVGVVGENKGKKKKAAASVVPPPPPPVYVHDFEPLISDILELAEVCYLEPRNTILHELGIPQNFRKTLEEKYGDQLPLPWSGVEHHWAVEEGESDNLDGIGSFSDELLNIIPQQLPEPAQMKKMQTTRMKIAGKAKQPCAMKKSSAAEAGPFAVTMEKQKQNREKPKGKTAAVKKKTKAVAMAKATAMKEKVEKKEKAAAAAPRGTESTKNKKKSSSKNKKDTSCSSSAVVKKAARSALKKKSPGSMKKSASGMKKISARAAKVSNKSVAAGKKSNKKTSMKQTPLSTAGAGGGTKGKKCAKSSDSAKNEGKNGNKKELNSTKKKVSKKEAAQKQRAGGGKAKNVAVKKKKK